MIASEIESHFWEIFDRDVFEDEKTQRDLLINVHAARQDALGRAPENEEGVITLSPSRIKKAHPDGCLRQLALQRDGASTAKPHPGIVMMRENGHQIHAMVGEMFSLRPPEWAAHILMEEYYEREIQFQGQPIVLRGFLDMAILHDLRGETGWEIVDFKSVRGAAFRYGEKDWPRPTDALQVRLYDVLAEGGIPGPSGRKYPVLGGSIVYIDREGQNFLRAKNVDLQENRDEMRECVKRAAEVVTTDVMPPVIPPVVKRKKVELSWVCRYCNYFNISCPGPEIPEVNP